MFSVKNIGAEWMMAEITALPETIERISPSQYNEATRYLPEAVTALPGYLKYDTAPMMREIVDCCDIDSPIREINVMKGVQITFTTSVIEAAVLYALAKVKTLPIMYMTADKELAKARIENNFLVMLQQSGLSGIIRSNDEGNIRKTGKTVNHIQVEGGAVLYPFGAKNADKMRAFSICFMFKDELDGWPLTVGKDGDPDALSDSRCDGYSLRKKIVRGSTPLILQTSKIYKQYKRGDQRVYRVLCKHCGFPQELRWSVENKDTGIVGGMHWETEGGVLIPESVSYNCSSCGLPHYEYDKARLFSPDHGAHWHPTAKAVSKYIRSYHLPAMYSPVGMKPWADCVSQYLEAYDPETKKVLDIGKYQVFYNNILAWPFEKTGDKIQFRQVSGHRRSVYTYREIPNDFAIKYCESKILMVTCQVDVHKTFLAVAVMGWTRGMRCFVIEKLRLEDTDCTETSSKVWGELQSIIEERRYVAPEGETYHIVITLVDAQYAGPAVLSFCSQYACNVYPILGTDRPLKNQRIKEFSEFTANDGTKGYHITVDHYKDRLAPVLRREWREDSGSQGPYHFNAPMNMTDADLEELTKETRCEKTDDKGQTFYYWHRSHSNARNELWDLLVYGNAAVEMVAYEMCIKKFELETIDWARFWDYIEKEKLYFAV